MPVASGKVVKKERRRKRRLITVVEKSGKGRGSPKADCKLKKEVYIIMPCDQVTRLQC